MSAAEKKPALYKQGGVAEFNYDPDTFKVTDEMKEIFNYDGCILVKNLLSGAEVARIVEQLDMNDDITGRGFGLADDKGRYSKLSLWNQPGSDLTGMVARCEKLVNTTEELLGGGEVYHYHTKLMMKDARTGGAHLWHQDYGYWYKNGCLKPDLATVFIPLDPCRKENGCLQVIKGTHRCGRIDHGVEHGQTVADTERVETLKQHFEHVYAEMDPGDGLFFHCNLLHTSDQNRSDTRRWCFLVAYNRADNNPVKRHHHPQYTKLEKVPNDAILTCQNLTDLSGKDFMDPTQDETIRATLKESNFH